MRGELSRDVAPTKDAEEALVCILVPGAYTATVQGAKGSSGIAMVEADNLP